VKLLSAVLVVLSLVGCASSPPPRTDVQASDGGVVVPVVRLSKSLGASSAAPSEAQDGVALEFSASRASGSDDQSLGGGAAPVEYNGRLFAAPQTLQHDFDLAVYDQSGRWRHFAYAELDLAVSAPGARATGTETAFGPLLGAGLIWRLRPATSVHGRFTVYAGLDPDEAGRRFELALMQSLARNLSVRAGYAHSRFEFEQGTASAIDVRLSGPMLGLELHF
jgi:hypothetical protein